MRLFAGTPFDIPPKCDRCGAQEADCKCPPLPVGRVPPNQQTAKLAIEKRKKGKVVTVIRDLSERANDLPALLSQLKSKCGAGGAIQEDCVEIQGEHLDRIRKALSELGFGVKG